MSGSQKLLPDGKRRCALIAAGSDEAAEAPPGIFQMLQWRKDNVADQRPPVPRDTGNYLR
jgi:hypothetical protein